MNVLALQLSSSNRANLKAKQDYTKQWQVLFTPEAQKAPGCDNNSTRPESAVFADSNATDLGVVAYAPKAKDNPILHRKHGDGDSAYLFDYIDELFQPDVTKAFNDVFTAAKALQKNDANDQYSSEKLLFILSQGGDKKDQRRSFRSQETGLARYLAGFNQKVWDESITIPQLAAAINTWSYGTGNHTDDIARKLLDEYDFNGDGRLDSSEFILLSIMTNEKPWKQKTCKNCYLELFNEKIDALFAYLDCNKDGQLSAEEMWKNLVGLNRKNKDAYNMYKCEMPTLLSKHFRTNSCNDFVLKNSETVDGFLTINEFRKGILLGYWARQVSMEKVATDDSLNKKSTRWNSSGTIDKQCKNILAMVSPTNNNGRRN